MRDPEERLPDILDAIAAIERHSGPDKVAFKRDELLQVWFLRHLQIIGEAARTLPADVQALAPEIPWSQIVGMRNILVHGYFDIDTDIVWDAATRDVPAIKPAVVSPLKRHWRDGANDPSLPGALVRYATMRPDRRLPRPHRPRAQEAQACRRIR